MVILPCFILIVGLLVFSIIPSICFTPLELEQLRKDSEAKRRKCEELTRERDKLDRQVRIQTTATDKQADMVKVHAQGVRTLESEVRVSRHAYTWHVTVFVSSYVHRSHPVCMPSVCFTY